MESFTEDVDRFISELEETIDLYAMPSEWFKQPDHLAVKVADAQAFEEWLGFFRPQAEAMSWTPEGGRRLAAVHLKTPLAIGSLGVVHWVEVMEPRPQKLGKDVVGIDHIEFIYPEFAEVETYLNDVGGPNNRQGNSNHSWVAVPLHKPTVKGQEFKLNDLSLESVIENERAQGLTNVINLRQQLAADQTASFLLVRFDQESVV